MIYSPNHARNKPIQPEKQGLQNTSAYTSMIAFKYEAYISATASTIEDAKKLVEAGFDYVTEIDGLRLSRKRK